MSTDTPTHAQQLADALPAPGTAPLVVLGTQGLVRTLLVQEAAQLAGRAVHVVNCARLTSTPGIMAEFIAAAGTGERVVMVLDHADALPADLESGMQHRLERCRNGWLSIVVLASSAPAWVPSPTTVSVGEARADGTEGQSAPVGPSGAMGGVKRKRRLPPPDPVQSPSYAEELDTRTNPPRRRAR